MTRCASFALVSLLAAASALAAPASHQGVVLDVRTDPFLGPPEVAARRGLGFLAPALGLPAGVELQHEATLPAGSGGHIVQFSQRHRGLPVLDARAAVRLTDDGSVIRVHSSLASLPWLETHPLLEREQAIRAARAAVRVPLPAEEIGAARLAIAPSITRLVWEVHVPTLVPVHAIVVLVDAESGAVLSVEDRARRATAKVFPSGQAAFEARDAGGSFDFSKLVEVQLTGLSETGEGTKLTSPEIVGFNCCPHEGCDGSSPPRKVPGQFTVPVSGIGDVLVNYNAAVCDEHQVAEADADGAFLYFPPAEPRPDTAIGAPADWDSFSEVMAYDAARSTFERMRTLDPQFRLSRDPNAPPLRVTTNFLLPDFAEVQEQIQACQQSFPPPCLTSLNPPTAQLTINRLMRFDNALFMPRGSTEGLGPMVPEEFKRDFDSVIMFQGTRADFGYDRSVVAHEVGHAVVNVEAGLRSLSADDWGVLDAPGAMNEGFADFWAATVGESSQVGDYVGHYLGQNATGEANLRDLENTLSCPSVISGEVHQDSQHFSAAIWAARQELATDAQTRIAFDRAVLDGLRGLFGNPYATFDQGAEAIAAEVGLAFDAQAQTLLEGEFSGRGVTGCERLLDLRPSEPRKGYILAGKVDSRFSNFAPGPMQFRIKPPAGTTSFELTVKGGAGGQLGGGEASLFALVRAGGRIKFTYSNAEVASNAAGEREFVTPQGSQDRATKFVINPGCGNDEYYLAFANKSASPFTVSELSVSYSVDPFFEDDNCGATDPDPDPDPEPVDPGSGGETPAPSGCNCASGAVTGLLPLAGLLVLRRRRLRR